MILEKSWYVFYTKARWEKKTFDLLKREGFKPWLPLVKEVHQWSDRKKKVTVPLFRSYIFVLSTESMIQEIVKTPGISWNIRLDGKPAILKDREKSMIERVLETGYSVEPISPSTYNRGDHVEIIEGPLVGLKGMVLSGNTSTILIQIDSLEQLLRVKLPSGLLKPGINSSN